MNLNISNNQDLQLREAVEYQLDLILKMQQQRKALKKQNRILHQKLKQLNSVVLKYQKQTKSMQTSTQTEHFDSIRSLNVCNSKQNEINQNQSRNFQEFGLQVQIQIQNISAVMNCSKLNEAQSLLKVLEVYESRATTNQENEKSMELQLKKNNKRQKQRLNQNQKQKQKISRNSVHVNDHEKQIAGEIIKLTKQLNTTKKELKQIEHKFKLRQKQIKDLKKCIQNKNEALQKSRKQFNELSLLMNSQKLKSVRNLQQQIQNLRTKLASQQEKDNTKIKNILSEITQEYGDYKKQSQKRIDVLISELANKQKQINSLQNQVKKMSFKNQKFN